MGEPKPKARPLLKPEPVFFARVIARLNVQFVLSKLIFRRFNLLLQRLHATLVLNTDDVIVDVVIVTLEVFVPGQELDVTDAEERRADVDALVDVVECERRVGGNKNYFSRLLNRLNRFLAVNWTPNDLK